MENLPLISVIVPVYGVEKYLNQCIWSITEQTYRNLEIILVDDGSPDNCGAICDAWAQKDSRIKVLHQKNAGAGAARNAALDMSKGELIAFVDSDDYIDVNMFFALYTLMEDGIDIAECGYVEIADNDALFEKTHENAKIYFPQEAMREHIRDTVFRQLIWNKLYRRSVIGTVRFPVGKKIDDEFFTYQVLANADRLILTHDVFYAYRQQRGSVMHEAFSLKRLDGLEAKRERLHFLQSVMPELELEAKADLVTSCLYYMQCSLQMLKDVQLEQACRILYSVVKEVRLPLWNPELTAKKNILVNLARWNLEATGRLLNFLEKVHVLT